MFRKRQLDACPDWKAFGEDLSGSEIPDFDIEQYQEEYVKADEDSKDDTFLGRSFLAALAIFAGVFGFVLKNRYCILYLRRRPRLQRDHAYHFCISPDRDCLYPVDTKKHWQDYAPVCIISRKSKGALREKEFLSERLFAR